jgi:hypothetical protein
MRMRALPGACLIAALNLGLVQILSVEDVLGPKPDPGGS